MKVGYCNREELIGYISGCEDAYYTIKAYYDNATTRPARDAFRDALESLPYNKRLDNVVRQIAEITRPL